MPSVTRTPGDHGEYIAKFDEEFRQRWRELGEWKELPENLLGMINTIAWITFMGYQAGTVGALAMTRYEWRH